MGSQRNVQAFDTLIGQHLTGQVVVQRFRTALTAEQLRDVGFGTPSMTAVNSHCSVDWKGGTDASVGFLLLILGFLAYRSREQVA